MRPAVKTPAAFFFCSFTITRWGRQLFVSGDNLARGAQAAFERPMNRAALALPPGGFAGEEEGLFQRLREHFAGLAVFHTADADVAVRSVGERIFKPVPGMATQQVFADAGGGEAEDAGEASDRLVDDLRFAEVGEALRCGAAGPGGEHGEAGGEGGPPGGEGFAARENEVHVGEGFIGVEGGNADGLPEGIAENEHDFHDGAHFKMLEGGTFFGEFGNEADGVGRFPDADGKGDEGGAGVQDFLAVIAEGVYFNMAGLPVDLRGAGVEGDGVGLEILREEMDDAVISAEDAELFFAVDIRFDAAIMGETFGAGFSDFSGVEAFDEGGGKFFRGGGRGWGKMIVHEVGEAKVAAAMLREAIHDLIDLIEKRIIAAERAGAVEPEGFADIEGDGGNGGGGRNSGAEKFPVFTCSP